jgi:hypothetical protein
VQECLELELLHIAPVLALLEGLGDARAEAIDRLRTSARPDPLSRSVRRTRNTDVLRIVAQEKRAAPSAGGQ